LPGNCNKTSGEASRESRLRCVLKENPAYGTLPDIRGIASSIS